MRCGSPLDSVLAFKDTSLWEWSVSVICYQRSPSFPFLLTTNLHRAFAIRYTHFETNRQLLEHVSQMQMIRVGFARIKWCFCLRTLLGALQSYNTNIFPFYYWLLCLLFWAIVQQNENESKCLYKEARIYTTFSKPTFTSIVLNKIVLLSRSADASWTLYYL